MNNDLAQSNNGEPAEALRSTRSAVADVRNFTVAVIGGGIAGPVAAVALRLAGIEATVYEASTQEHPDRMGAMLTLAPNGIAALSSIGLTIPKSLGQVLTRTVMVGPQGRQMGAFDGLHDLGPSKALWR
jgi:2-polyprenyl-6-methoxyphenol hydroxylase-like FAD-dependent oxidoreductase